MRAGAVLLVNLLWHLGSKAPADADRSVSGDGWDALHVLPCLRPYLVGHVAAAVDRIGAEPDRSIHDLCDVLAEEL